MLNSIIKRAVIDGQNVFKNIVFNYRNKSFLENVWDLISESLGEEYHLISSPKITPTNVLFFKGKNILDNKFIICKIPLDEEALVRSQLGFRNISTLHKNKILSSNLIPAPIKMIKSPHGNIYIESLFVGTDGQEAVRKKLLSPNDAIKQGINVIKEIQAGFPQYSMIVTDDLISQFINEIKENFSCNGIEDYHHERVKRLLEKIRNKEITLGFSHGDYWLGNILFNHDVLVGIIDWDRFRLDHPVVYDTIHLDIFYHAMSNGRSLGEELISRYKRDSNNDLIIYWFYFLKNSINSNPLIIKDKRWLEKNYFKVILNLT